MLHRAFPLVALSLCSVVAACAGSAGETTEASHEPLSLTFGALSVTPTDTTVTIAYEEPGTTPLAVTLGGHTVTATLVPGGATQNQTVTFSGLAPCASYSWSIPTPNGVVTGQTNTHWTGNVACATTNVLKASQLVYFEGGEHQEQNNFGCGNWSSTWPVGYSWTDPIYQNTEAFYTYAEFGYGHTSNGSSWCAESTVHAWRSKLTFDVSPTQLARGVTRAVLTANYVSSGDSIPSNNPVCSQNLAYLVQHPWPEPNDPGDFASWENILHGVPYVDVIVPQSWTFSLIATSTSSSTDENNGTLKSVVFNQPEVMTDPYIVTGFASPNDGYPDLMAAESVTWAADGHSCRTTLSNVAMTISFQPLPPETPLCTAAIACNTATITCASSPEIFTLESSAGTSLGTFDATGGATPTFTTPYSGTSQTFQVCTQNTAGATACAPVTLVSDVACPPCVVTTSCAGSCGSLPDNCGGTLACGGCAAPLVCSNYNVCQKCAKTLTCTGNTYFDEATCRCVANANTCECGGTYPKCKACQ